MAGSNSYPAAGTNTAGQTISTDRFMVDNVDEELANIITMLEEIVSELYSDMDSIDSMQSKYLDVVSDEVTIIKNELEDLISAVVLAATNNSDIYEAFKDADFDTVKGL